MQPTLPRRFVCVSSYVPPGGYGLADGRVLTAAQVKHAVRLFARRRGYYERTVRTVSVLFRQAMSEYAGHARSAA